MFVNAVSMRRHLFVVLGATLLLYICGCAPAVSVHKEIRASIERDPYWKIQEKCGDDDCTVLVDFLTGKDMTIKIEFDNDQQTKRFFIIRTDFTSVTTQAQYNPTNSVAKLSTGETLKPKAFTCYYTINDLEYLRARPSVEGSFPVRKSDCYLLFFDHPILSEKDELILNLNDVFSVSGKRLQVPQIRFKKSMDNK
jgi:hypothetical protein